MTVTPITFYALLWAFLLCAAGCVFFSSRLADRRDQCDQLKRIVNVNEVEHQRELAIFVSGILDRAKFGNALPGLDSKKWSAMQDLYDDPQLIAETIPAQITTDTDDRPVIYWKHLSPNGLTAYELARLWLAGIL